jgi:hypothetical protein
MCNAAIVWPDGRVQKRRAGGMDSAQALSLALAAVGGELLTSAQPVYWHDPDDDLSLPALNVFADEVAERKARYEAR